MNESARVRHVFTVVKHESRARRRRSAHRSANRRALRRRVVPAYIFARSQSSLESRKPSLNFGPFFILIDPPPPDRSGDFHLHVRHDDEVIFVCVEIFSPKPRRPVRRYRIEGFRRRRSHVACTRALRSRRFITRRFTRRAHQIRRTRHLARTQTSGNAFAPLSELPLV